MRAAATLRGRGRTGAPRPAAAQIVYLFALGGFVTALGFAILKYRLYDVDVVINRTLVYGALAVCITVVYVMLVVGVGSLVGAQGDPNILLSLLATALVGVAFQPVRDRLQRLANRLVYGHRSSPYEVLAGFSRRVSGALSVDAVLPQMAEAAARGVGATRARVRVYVPGGRDQAMAWPADSVAETFDQTVPVVHQGSIVGEIALAKAPGDRSRFVRTTPGSSSPPCCNHGRSSRCVLPSTCQTRSPTNAKRRPSGNAVKTMTEPGVWPGAGTVTIDPSPYTS